YYSCAHRYLHSFPTRRSSDLRNKEDWAPYSFGTPPGSSELAQGLFDLHAPRPVAIARNPPVEIQDGQVATVTPMTRQPADILLYPSTVHKVRNLPARSPTCRLEPKKLFSGSS